MITPTLLLAFSLLLSLPSPTDLPQTARETGQAVGTAAQKVKKEAVVLGKEAKRQAVRAGREIRKGAKAAAKETGQAVKEAGKGVREGLRK